MDGIREQLVVKPRDSSDGIKKALILMGALLAAIILLTVILTVGNAILTELGILLAIGIIWGGWWLTGSLNVEYEYIVFNNELQVDKIINKRSRKTLCSLNLRKAEAFYRSEKHLENATEINVCGDGDKYTIEYSDGAYGKTVLIFTPDERTLAMITPYLPRAI